MPRTREAKVHTEGAVIKTNPADWYALARPRPFFRGWFHRAAFVLSPLWVVHMLWRCSTYAAVISAGLSLFSKTLLFGASSTYHITQWRSVKAERRIASLDLSAISLTIAFSMAPAYALLLEYGMLFLLFAAAAAGLSAWLAVSGASKAARTAAYVLQGFLSAAPVLYFELQEFEKLALAVTGAAYLAGACIYASERPDPYPDHFGYHELWHLLVIVASAGTYTANLSILERMYTF